MSKDKNLVKTCKIQLITGAKETGSKIVNSGKEDSSTLSFMKKSNHLCFMNSASKFK